MKTIELFSGTKSFSKVAIKYGHQTFTVDNDNNLAPDLCVDMRKVANDNLPKNVEVVWASPPCQAFSVAAIGRNWGGGFRGYIPKTESGKLGLELATKTRKLIEEANPAWWFIENPRGLLRKMGIFEGMKGVLRHTVSYCQYGDTRMKPTDIWTNTWWWTPRAMCSNGSPCHEAAPRGAKTGTQGIKGAKDRGRIPSQLFEEIFAQMPEPANDN